MTAGEVRDRLDHRFRLLVGSRRGLERHQTLRHAVQWSYDLLAEPEKALLDRMFGVLRRLLTSKAPARSSDSETNSPPRSVGRVGAQVVACRRPVGRSNPVLDAGDHSPVRRGPARRSWCGRRGPDGTRPPLRGAAKPTSCRYGTVLGSGEAYDWFAAELAEPAQRVSLGGRPWRRRRGRATIAAYCVVPRRTCEPRTYEPIAWAEELIEPARVAVDHPQTRCTLRAWGRSATRPDESKMRVRYCEAGQAVVGQRKSTYVLPYPRRWLRRWPHVHGQPERCGRGDVAHRSSARP